MCKRNNMGINLLKISEILHEQAGGAWLNGSRVKKIGSMPGDAHSDGARGTVRASLGPVRGEYGYFVEWDDVPRIPVFIRGNRLALI